MARMLGAGGADKAGEAILKRKVKIDEATEEKTAKGTEQPSLPAQKMKDASGNTYRVKNTGANGYYMPILKGFTLKNYFTFDAK